MKIYVDINKQNQVCGFYNTSINGKSIPRTALEITAKEWQYALEINANAYENGKFIVKDFRTQQEITDDLASAERHKRDRLIDKVEWRLLRYERQKALGVPTTDTESWYLGTLRYVQALRDVPEQAEFPFKITWPVITK